MKIEMTMPQMGESIAEGTILKWRKGVGDTVEQDEDILEISTDKVDSEIPSPATGAIAEIKVQEGETVPIKTVLAVIESVSGAAVGGVEKKKDDSGEDAAASSRPSPRESSPHDASDAGGLQVREFKRKSKEQEEQAAPQNPPTGEKSTFLSPLVQNIAADHNIPLDEVHAIQGTGRDGRVTKKDILAYIAERKVSGVAAQPAPAPVVPQPVAPALTPAAETAAPVWRSATDEIVEMDRMRRAIADHMVRSAHTSPHVVSYSEVDMNRIVEHRERIKDDFKRQEGINITYTSYFLHLVAKALKEYPYLNSSVDGYNVILRKQVNIGFAVELPNAGLIVPVIRGVDALSLTGIARGLHELAEKARAGRLSPDDVSGGTFTVTNVGVFGNISGAPIINQPQVAILGTGAIRKVPAVIETPAGDAIGIRRRLVMSMSYDHRIIDGAMAGRFMARLKDLMENFEG